MPYCTFALRYASESFSTYSPLSRRMRLANRSAYDFRRGPLLAGAGCTRTCSWFQRDRPIVTPPFDATLSMIVVGTAAADTARGESGRGDVGPSKSPATVAAGEMASAGMTGESSRAGESRSGRRSGRSLRPGLPALSVRGLQLAREVWLAAVTGRAPLGGGVVAGRSTTVAVEGREPLPGVCGLAACACGG